LRGILNAGHRRTTAYALRTVAIGNDYETKHFSVWAAKAVAAIGKIAGTLEERKHG